MTKSKWGCCAAVKSYLPMFKKELCYSLVTIFLYWGHAAAQAPDTFYIYCFASQPERGTSSYISKVFAFNALANSDVLTKDESVMGSHFDAYVKTLNPSAVPKTTCYSYKSEDDTKAWWYGQIKMSREGGWDIHVTDWEDPVFSSQTNAGEQAKTRSGIEVSTAAPPVPQTRPKKQVKLGCGGCVLGTPHCAIPKPGHTCLAK